MNQHIIESLEELRVALLELPAIGEAGFEGLIGTTLAEIAGMPFRLASSGSQFGVDGKSAYASDGISFEGKRYDSDIPRSEVLSKIAELSMHDRGEADVWVLGSTRNVSTQLADAVTELARKDGIEALILDWSAIVIPPFAVAVAMSENASAFLNKHLKPGRASKAAAAIKIIRGSCEFSEYAERIHASLTEPSIGYGMARQANSNWLTNIFSNRNQAKRFLGQPLSPADKSVGILAPRATLVGQLNSYLLSKPSGNFAVVLGEEGNGKSWLVAQSWLLVEEKPVLLIFSADELHGSVVASKLVQTLIDKLIEQTGSLIPEKARKSWFRRWNRWRSQEVSELPRLIVFIDGLNQRPDFDWATLLEALHSELYAIGGKLVVTMRTMFYTERVERRLHSARLTLIVPEWTDTERDAILEAHGIKSSGLQPPVAAFLKNPRLLGIALELLQNATITELDELSASRQLFEHIRVHEQDFSPPRSAHEFARKLQDHAQQVLSRAKSQQRNDLKIFDGGLEAVSDGRFFRPVQGDPTRYRLDEEGLTLALGFAILDELRSAHRNQNNLTEALATMIEPISSLDRTAAVILAALTVTCLDIDSSLDIGATIVAAFSNVQNPDSRDFPAFSALARKRPEVFMEAAYRLCVIPIARRLNFDWIADALRMAKADELAWAVMTPILQAWLSHWSRSPTKRILPQHSRTAEEATKQRDEKLSELEARVGALSFSERELLNKLFRYDDGDLSTLTRFALTLLAGKPLAPFAAALVDWSFSNALNSDYMAPYREFRNLVTLNRADWSKARSAILEASARLEVSEVSSTGKWALSNLLTATGAPEDAARAQALIAELTSDHRPLLGWRAIEDCCAADPCDPRSSKPENLNKTAVSYAALDVSKICLTRGYTQNERFFSMARLGIARFDPEVAIGKHREFIEEVLIREGFPLLQGLLEIRRHNALLTSEHAAPLLKCTVPADAKGGKDTLSGLDRWRVSQYRLLLAFPLLSASAQFDALLQEPKGETTLLDLFDVAKPLDKQTFDSFLEEAVARSDERAQLALLLLSRGGDRSLSSSTRGSLELLASADSERIRAQALHLIAQMGDDPLLEAVTSNRRMRMNPVTDDSVEGLYGSLVILEAAGRGLILPSTILDRIAPRYYGRAANRFGKDVAHQVALRIDASIRNAVGLSGKLPALDIEMPIQDGETADWPVYILSERISGSQDPFERIKQISDIDDSYEEHERRIGAAFQAFKEQLTQSNARIILDSFGLQEFDAIVAADRILAESWYEIFVNLPAPQLPPVWHLGLLLAHAFATWDTEKSVHLFTIFERSGPFVRFTFHRSGIPLDAMSVWSAQDHADLDSFRITRLDKAANDKEIEFEVLAALSNGKGEFLEKYVEAKFRTNEPAEIARGLMAAGLSLPTEHTDALLTRYQDVPGFIGMAQTAARYAYDRNVWADHWFRQMCEAEEPTDFWRYSVLFIKIVDGRFDIWQSRYDDFGPPFRSFWPSVQSQLAERYRKWRAKREKTLFGQEVPSNAFLIS